MAAADSKNKASGKTVPGLRVVAKSAGFRRAGRTWSTTPTEVPASEFDRQQQADLRAESQLVVTDIELDVAAPDSSTDEK